MLYVYGHVDETRAVFNKQVAQLQGAHHQINAQLV